MIHTEVISPSAFDSEHTSYTDRPPVETEILDSPTEHQTTKCGKTER